MSGGVVDPDGEVTDQGGESTDQGDHATDPNSEDWELDREAGARGALYALGARLLEHPTEDLHAGLADGSLAAEVTELVELTDLAVDPPALETDDDYDTLAARYNDLFALGYAEYEDRTDGTLHTNEPPVPLHESAHRTDASWTDVNLDLNRAYAYYDLEMAEGERAHHDHLALVCEFAGYLARREAAVDGEEAAAARLDLLDRHLRIGMEGVVEQLAEETGVGVYGPAIELIDALSAADRDDLAARLEGST